MLLLLAISLFAKVQLLLPEFFCEGTIQPLSVFLKSIDWPMEQTFNLPKKYNRIPVDGALTLKKKKRVLFSC